MSYFVFCALGTLFKFTSALWQHTASAIATTVLEASAVSIVRGSVGTVATVLAWFVVGLWILAFVMLLIVGYVRSREERS
ncbi:hypothetical protein BU26DRAFT_513806 [Trematosphaeria pertusa]|uniref:Uncharacterized protein n=1 Tax=Trematosphaeria pertusa TaxID=390896 RepID=A0A6A6J388_9PLEO|nr:uncharacterized protein BU26DRAFT_513806 [Trematosphaeria pertusa]KAF2257096.1 hypothetical protein BU26DRAFT_513806 [Trematosphaeria pertusa]